MYTSDPYLSVVVVTRNDDHGGDPLKRLQAFVNTFDEQCRRTGLDAELVVVEWNPPDDRPRLHQLVRQPALCAFALRFVEVPPDLHAQLRFGEVLPLFQMIGKNVGIRRARGRFIVCTNIDIIFSNELVEYLASARLAPGTIYRVDRHDIEPDFPVDGTLEEQIAYCRTHQLRLHVRDGTYHVNQFGDVAALEHDVVGAPVVRLGAGWHVREGNTVFGYYRWAGQHAQLLIDRSAAPELTSGVVLSLELEPNAYQPGSWFDIEILDGDRRLATRRISRVSANVTRLNVALDDRIARHTITLKVLDSSGGRECLPLFERRMDLVFRLWRADVRRLPMLAAPLCEYDADRWTPGSATADLRADEPASTVTVVSDPGRFSYAAKYGPLQIGVDGVLDFVLRYSCSEGEISFGIMDGADGSWLNAEALEIHHDGVATRTLSAELARGQKVWLFVSNNHPDGSRASRIHLHRLCGSVPLSQLRETLDLVAVRRSLRGRLVRSAKLCVRIARRVRDSARYRAARAFGNTQKASAPVAVVATDTADLSGTAAELDWFSEFLRGHRPAHVHQNACGDFQLMARDHWFALHGYPEFAMYSMNIDGLLGTMAHAAGIREQALEMPLCIYHLEHEKGSGWTPEGEALLKRRMAESGITWLDSRAVHIWSAYMDWLGRPMIFNGADWGFGEVLLSETTLQHSSTVSNG